MNHHTDLIYVDNTLQHNHGLWRINMSKIKHFIEIILQNSLIYGFRKVNTSQISYLIK